MNIASRLSCWIRFAVAFGLAASLSAARAEDGPSKLESQCKTSVEQFQKADSGLKALMDAAVGYVVLPSVAKGGLVFGGARGDGLAYEKGKVIGKASLTQVTVGAQIGGQEFSELILFETKEALDSFKESKLSMNAQISAVAAAEGASKNAKYQDGVMVFTRAKVGLMAEASVGGQKLKFEALK